MDLRITTEDCARPMTSDREPCQLAAITNAKRPLTPAFHNCTHLFSNLLPASLETRLLSIF